MTFNASPNALENGIKIHDVYHYLTLMVKGFVGTNGAVGLRYFNRLPMGETLVPPLAANREGAENAPVGNLLK